MKFLPKFFVFLILFCFTLPKLAKRPRKLFIYHNKKHKKPRKTCDVISAMQAVQKKFEVHHHDLFTFDKIGGGLMNIVLPRDAPTVIVNQMPMRGFRLKQIDNE